MQGTSRFIDHNDTRSRKAHILASFQILNLPPKSAETAYVISIHTSDERRFTATHEEVEVPGEALASSVHQANSLILPCVFLQQFRGAII